MENNSESGSLIPFLSRQRPPDLSICTSEVPPSPSDSGYQTGGGGGIPESASRVRHFTTRFFPSDEEELDDLDCEELEDDVFEAPECVMAEDKERVVAKVPLMRNRAFSFPFTLSDVHFSNGTGLSFSGLSLIQRRQFGSRFVIPGSRASPLGIWDGNDGRGDQVQEDFDVDDIDDYDEKLPSDQSRPPSDPKDFINVPDAGSPHDVPNFSGSRLMALPDLILSGTRHGRHLHHSADTPDSRNSNNSMEFAIACRLAQIGDEFEAKFFSSNGPLNGDSPDSGRSLGAVSLSSASRLWQYLTKSSNAGRTFTRQRSRSTAD